MAAHPMAHIAVCADIVEKNSPARNFFHRGHRKQEVVAAGKATNSPGADDTYKVIRQKNERGKCRAHSAHEDEAE